MTVSSVSNYAPAEPVRLPCRAQWPADRLRQAVEPRGYLVLDEVVVEKAFAKLLP